MKCPPSPGAFEAARIALRNARSARRWLDAGARRMAGYHLADAFMFLGRADANGLPATSFWRIWRLLEQSRKQLTQ